jgi:hypothetical protein
MASFDCWVASARNLAALRNTAEGRTGAQILEEPNGQRYNVLYGGEEKSWAILRAKQRKGNWSHWTVFGRAITLWYCIASGPSGPSRPSTGCKNSSQNSKGSCLPVVPFPPVVAGAAVVVVIVVVVAQVSSN